MQTSKAMSNEGAQWIERWTCNPRLWVRISAPAGIVHDWVETLEQGTEPPTAHQAPQRQLPTAPCVCVLGWVKCREHISLLVILCIIVYVTNKAHLSLIASETVRLNSANGGRGSGKWSQLGKKYPANHQSVSSLLPTSLQTIVQLFSLYKIYNRHILVVCWHCQEWILV